MQQTVPSPLEQIRATARSAEQKRLAAAILLEQAGQADAAPRSSASSMLRKAPEADAQADLFIPALLDLSTKDSRSLMDVAVFRLSKRDKRASETIRHELTDGYVEVTAGPSGMASIWDYDIMLMAISYLTEATNRYRNGQADKPTRMVRPSVVDILKFCRRSDGGRQYIEVENALDRLKNTTLKIVRTRQGRSGRIMREVTGEGLLSNYRVMSYAENGVIASVELEVPHWVYHEIVESDHPEVLTVHNDYFLIEPGMGRFLYRLARRVAGRGRARWSFKLIYNRSGSTGSFKEFSRMLRRLIEADDLPEYSLVEEAGKSGPMLVITNRDAKGSQLKKLPVDDDSVEDEEPL